MLLSKNDFVENVWPANSVLFVNVSTHCVETGEDRRERVTKTV